jgi:hypothetical protein
MNRTAASLAATVLLGLFAVACRSQDFSAEVAYDLPTASDASSHAAAPTTTTSSKLYLSKEKMRLDSAGVRHTVLLIDFASHESTAIFPEQKAYQVLAAGPPQYFRVTDADNACPDWRKAVGRDIACERLGDETVAGRKTVKYLNRSVGPGGSATSVWIDRTLKFVVKWRDADGGAELHNIHEGPQAADLFVVPPGYEALKAQKPGHWKSKS